MRLLFEQQLRNLKIHYKSAKHEGKKTRQKATSFIFEYIDLIPFCEKSQFDF